MAPAVEENVALENSEENTALEINEEIVSKEYENPVVGNVHDVLNVDNTPMPNLFKFNRASLVEITPENEIKQLNGNNCITILFNSYRCRSFDANGALIMHRNSGYGVEIDQLNGIIASLENDMIVSRLPLTPNYRFNIKLASDKYLPVRCIKKSIEWTYANAKADEITGSDLRSKMKFTLRTAVEDWSDYMGGSETDGYLDDSNTIGFITCYALK